MVSLTVPVKVSEPLPNLFSPSKLQDGGQLAPASTWNSAPTLTEIAKAELVLKTQMARSMQNPTERAIESLGMNSSAEVRR
jgi:hypothetical protein